jgi:hypothetical protein
MKNIMQKKAGENYGVKQNNFQLLFFRIFYLFSIIIHL